MDYDRDGRLDVFVANYVKWSEATDKRCALDGKNKWYCTPEVYPGVPSKLFRNLGAGKFADVSQKAGVANPGAKALGVALVDYDADGWVDLFVANDTQPNQLFRNNGNGTFTDNAVAAGVAFSDDGVARGAMGADAADYDRSGRPHLLVSNFQNQMLALYRNEGGGLFTDVAPASPVGRASMATLGFGAFFFDYDLDGWLDVFATNGHIEESVTTCSRRSSSSSRRCCSATPARDGSKASRRRSARISRCRRWAAAPLTATTIATAISTCCSSTTTRRRGCCATTAATAGTGSRSGWPGTRANRSGIGAIVRVQSPQGTQWQMVRSGSSYCSQSDLAVTFGLGKDTAATSIEIEWPGGAKEQVENVPAKSFVKIVEGKGWVNNVDDCAIDDYEPKDRFGRGPDRAASSGPNH